MLVRQFIVVSTIISASFAGEYNEILMNNNFDDGVNEGSPCEVKVAEVLKQEISKLNDINKKILESLEVINRKMDASEKKMQSKLEELDDNFVVLGKRNNDFEETLKEKLHKQEQKIIDKLEQYIDEKSDSLENHIYRKINALEKIVADKTDIAVINHKLDTWKINLPELEDRNVTCDSTTLAKATLTKMSNELTQKFEVIEIKISELENATSNFKFDELANNVLNVEGSFNRKWTELKKLIPDMENSIKKKIDALNIKIPEDLEEHVNLKFDSLGKSIMDLKEDIIFHLNGTNIHNYTGVDQKCLKKKNESLGYWNCKEREAKGYHLNPIAMGSEIFNYVHYNMVSGMTYFETHFAIKGDSSGHVLLSQTANPGASDEYFAIDIGDNGNSKTRLRTDTPSTKGIEDLSFVASPEILNTTRFTAFYIKIINGTLELGKEGSTTPLLKYTDARFNQLKYIDFTCLDTKTVKYLYDCPPHFEETLNSLNALQLP